MSGKGRTFLDMKGMRMALLCCDFIYLWPMLSIPPTLFSTVSDCSVYEGTIMAVTVNY